MLRPLSLHPFFSISKSVFFLKNICVAGPYRNNSPLPFEFCSALSSYSLSLGLAARLCTFLLFDHRLQFPANLRRVQTCVVPYFCPRVCSVWFRVCVFVPHPHRGWISTTVPWFCRCACVCSQHFWGWICLFPRDCCIFIPFFVE